MATSAEPGRPCCNGTRGARSGSRSSSTRISPSLFTPGYTLASAIANQFTEADKAIYFSAIVACALVLLLVAAAMNVLARLLVWSVARAGTGAVTAA
jgi:hypothetical protein